MIITWCGGTLLACALAGGILSEARAQPARRELVGRVRDSTGAPIEGATVETSGAATRTDVLGAFQLWTRGIDTATLTVRRFGYAPVRTLLAARGGAWDTVVVELNAIPRVLAPVDVKQSATRRALGLREFESRRAMGLGLFITRDEIAARNSMRPSDALRSVRGVNLVRLRNGSYGVRFSQYMATRPACAPDLWIDGQLARGMEIDDLTANDIEAMELYESWATVPFQFSQGSAVPCGTIVLWTRVPGQ